MKRRKKLILICGIILLGVCGCSNSNNKELENRIEMLENKINTLEEKNNSNLLTKEELVGTWESSSGTILNFNKDGSYTSSLLKDVFWAYDIFEDYIVICSNLNQITTCFNDTGENIVSTYFYVYNGKDKIILTEPNMNRPNYITWTRK